MEAGKKRLAGDTARAVNTDEVKDLRREARGLKEIVAEQTFELRLVEGLHLSARVTLAKLGLPSIVCRFHVLTCVGVQLALGCDLLNRLVPAQRLKRHSSPLNLSEKFRRFVILVSIRSCWIHLSTLSSFAGPLQSLAPSDL